MYHQGASSRGWRRTHPPRGQRMPSPTMFVTRSIPGTPFHRIAGWEYANPRSTTSPITRTNSYFPSNEVRGPEVSEPARETKFEDTYHARRIPRPANPTSPMTPHMDRAG